MRNARFEKTGLILATIVCFSSASWGTPAWSSEPPSFQAEGARPPRDTILLWANKTLAAPVNYVLETRNDQLPPGSLREWFTTRKCTVRFDRGGSFGVAEYELTSGAYQFVLTDRGLDLQSKTFTVTLDNSRNATEFNFVRSGRYVTAKELRSEVSESFSSSDSQEVIPAGQTKVFTTKYPLVITFDRGDGSTPARRRLCDGTFLVGVNPSTNLIDVISDASTKSTLLSSSPSSESSTKATQPASAPAVPPAPAPEPAPTLTGSARLSGQSR